MGYVLFWLESLATTLLFVATVTACIGRSRRPAQLTFWVLAALVPLAIYAALAGLMAYLHIKGLAPARWLYVLLAWTFLYAAGAIWIRLAATRRAGDETAEIAAARWPRGKLALALGVVFALHLMTFWNLDLAVSQQLATLRTEAGALALSVAPARVPDRDNAAVIYEWAFEEMGSEEAVNGSPEGWDERWDKWLKPGGSELDLPDEKLRQFLARQASARTLLLQAAGKPGCYFDRDYGRPSYEILLPELAQLRTAARLLALDARCRADDGRMAAALADVNALFAMAAHASSDPILVSELVAIAIDEMALDAFQAVLAAGQPTADDLTSLKFDLDAGVSYRRLLDRALRMEEAFGQSLVCRMSEQWDFHWLQTGESDRETWRTRGTAALYRVFLLGDDLAAYRYFMGRCRELAAKPYYEAKNRWRSFEEQFQDEPGGLLAQGLSPAVAMFADYAARADARRRIAGVVLAMHRYRAAGDQFPERLEELTPKFIGGVPRDPFDGKPMRLKRTKRGLVVYSVGPDLADDGGKPFDKDEKTGDLTFEFSP